MAQLFSFAQEGSSGNIIVNIGNVCWNKTWAILDSHMAKPDNVCRDMIAFFLVTEIKLRFTHRKDLLLLTLTSFPLLLLSSYRTAEFFLDTMYADLRSIVFIGGCIVRSYFQNPPSLNPSTDVCLMSICLVQYVQNKLLHLLTCEFLSTYYHLY